MHDLFLLASKWRSFTPMAKIPPIDFMQKAVHLHYSMRDAVQEDPLFFLKWINDKTIQLSSLNLTYRESQVVLYNASTDLDIITPQAIVPCAYINNEVQLNKIKNISTECACILLSPRIKVPEFENEKMLKMICQDPFKFSRLKLSSTNLYSKMQAIDNIFPVTPTKPIMWFPVETCSSKSSINKNIFKAKEYAEENWFQLLVTWNAPYEHGPVYADGVMSLCFSLFETFDSFYAALSQVVCASSAYYSQGNEIHYYEYFAHEEKIPVHVCGELTDLTDRSEATNERWL